MKARRLPLLVDAHQWFPPGDDRHDAVNTPVVHKRSRDLVTGDITGFPDSYEIQTNGTIHELEPADWIIRRTYDDGTTCVYVISDDAFKRGYELVPTAAEILGIPS